MHIGRHIIQEMVLKFGEPTIERWSFSMEREEFSELKRQIGLGRAHDVTVLIVRGADVVVVWKPEWPSGAYRAPSGAVHPEESFVGGAAREARDQTGLEVEIEGYLLSVQVRFTCGEEVAKWSTHVLTARPLSDTLSSQEVSGVAAARWMSWDEILNRVNPILRASGLAALTHRARLHEKAHDLLVASHRQSEGKR